MIFHFIIGVLNFYIEIKLTDEFSKCSCERTLLGRSLLNYKITIQGQIKQFFQVRWDE